MKRKRAFTLVEVMIVVAMIAVLAVLGFVWYSKSQAKARDLHRVNIANNIKQALELYYDQYKAYPSSSGCDGTPPGGVYADLTGNWCTSPVNASDAGTAWISSDSKFLPFLANQPIDPKPNGEAKFGQPGTFFYYKPSSSANWYILAFALEDRANYKGEDGVRPNKSVQATTADGYAAIVPDLCCQADNIRAIRFDTNSSYLNVVTLGNTRGGVMKCSVTDTVDYPSLVETPCSAL